MTYKSLEIIEVISKKELNNFIKFPYQLYAGDYFYVPPLMREMEKKFSRIRNPFFKHADVRFFLALKNGKTVGRITSIINHRHIEFHNEKAGFFGFFETINDQRVSSALLDTVSESLRESGMDIMRGPMSFSTNDECGLLIEGFQNYPMIMTPYNPPYYREIMEEYGLKKAKDLYAYIIDIPDKLPDKIGRAAEIAERRGINVRPINIKKFDDEMEKFKIVYHSAWEKNWGFIPLTDEELSYLGNDLKPFLVPEITLIAEKGDEPVGFMGVLPDYNFVLKKMKGRFNLISILKAIYYSKKIKDLRLLLLGIKTEFRQKGVDALLFREGFKGAKKIGYKRAEFSWVLEDNIAVQRLVEMIQGRLYKKYRIYEKNLL